MKTKYWAYIGIGVTCLLLFATCDGCGESNLGEVCEYEQSSGDSSYEQASVSFSDERDVRTYLCSHRFSSSDGYTLSFSNYANEVSLNGQPLSSNVEIRSVSSNGAVIRTQGPYGNTTFRLSVSGSDGVIQDSNDGEAYYSR